MVRNLITMFGLVSMVFGAGAAVAAIAYDAELVPELVIPNSGASAYGQSTLIVDDTATTFALTVNFAGLDTPQTEAKLLWAAADSPGVELLTLPVGTPLALSLPYTADIAEALENGELAIQIYSQDWPAGAIRGNFRFVTVGVDAATWSRVKALFQ
ncbi:MAG: CHRD domain-containing protein [Candidatus Krumholzibacteria bacterium]|nr:CHRD domain-containing protein [Candidatus Krumholzibacteria bacterium]